MGSCNALNSVLHAIWGKKTSLNWRNYMSKYLYPFAKYCKVNVWLDLVGEVVLLKMIDKD